MKRGRHPAIEASNPESKKTVVRSVESATAANNKGPKIAAALENAVSVDTADIRFFLGTIMGSKADRAGPASVWAPASIAMPTYIIIGCNRLAALAAPSATNVIPASPWENVMSRFLSQRSASVPAHKVIGVCTSNCTTPMKPTQYADPVSSNNHWAVPKILIQTAMEPSIKVPQRNR